MNNRRISPAIQDYDSRLLRPHRGPPGRGPRHRGQRRNSGPKLIINATGDQFFVPDSSRFYFDDLRGEKHLRYVPNADHSLHQTDVEDSVLAFYRSIVKGAPRPEFTWTFEPDGSIRVRTGGPQVPTEVRLWKATNPAARDFRLETLGPVWRSTVIAPQPDGGDGPPLKMTTAVRVLPDTQAP